ncbi:hypothetical protein MNB_SV-14-1749 [hydrothermal vent metagenome]|uniref:Uncharacterized protein n=1 Tax=hydrothermal vent metagenome TaxID=652676 RepID=A0A1W1BL68_9ZZZZ
MEASLQKANTLGEMIEKLYVYYNKSVFLFFMIHPTFYFILFVSIYLNIVNFYIIAILLIKTFDIFFKIELIKQRYIKKDMDKELEMMLNLKMAPWMGLLGVIMYVPLLFMAIFSQ